MNNKICMGILAHVDAGKTTTTEAILYNAGITKNIGDVNKGTTMMDTDELERKRGITIYSDQISFKFNDVEIQIIDTPGHTDFSYEVEKSIKAVDFAILIVSAIEGVRMHTIKIWNILKSNKIPTIIVVNKVDRAINSVKEIINDINEKLVSNIVIMNKLEIIKPNRMEYYSYLSDKKEVADCIQEEYVGNKNYGKDYLLDELSKYNDELLEEIINENNISKNNLYSYIAKSFYQRKCFPIYFISAYKNGGVEILLKDISELSKKYERDNDEKLKFIIYNIKKEFNKPLLAYIKVETGVLSVRDVLEVNGEMQKITEIRIYNGDSHERVNQLVEGQIGVIVGLDKVKIGQKFGFEDETSEKAFKPLMRTKIISNNEDMKLLYNKIKILEIENDTLDIVWHNTTDEISMMVMGDIHMQILKESILKRFGYKIDFSEPRVAYLEKPSKESQGFCHYEPKKHCAEVEVLISPLEDGKGVQFCSSINQDIMPMQYQNIIKKTIPEAVKHGSILGAPVTDIKITLIAGKYDLEHTHGGDFRIATIRAVQDALEKNKMFLIEPIYLFEAEVDSSLSSNIISDIVKMKGEFIDSISKGERIKILGEVPISNALNYPALFQSKTKGVGLLNLSLLKYSKCHNEEEIINDEENLIPKDTHLYNSISLFRENRKMKKVK
jgi:translation elongation factor EF-G